MTTIREEEAALDSKISGIAKALAQALGREWVYVPGADLRSHKVVKTLPEGTQEISLFAWMNRDQKVHASVHVLNDKFDPYDKKNMLTSVSVSPDRNPVAAAKDIVRRLLPTFETLWPVAVARMNATNAFENGKKATVAKILEVFPESKESKDGEVAYVGPNYHRHASFKSSNGTVDVTLNGIPVDLAVAIARLVKANL